MAPTYKRILLKENHYMAISVYKMKGSLTVINSAYISAERGYGTQSICSHFKEMGILANL